MLNNTKDKIENILRKTGKINEVFDDFIDKEIEEIVNDNGISTEDLDRLIQVIKSEEIKEKIKKHPNYKDLAKKTLDELNKHKKQTK